MSKGNTFENDLLLLIFNAAAALKRKRSASGLRLLRNSQSLKLLRVLRQRQNSLSRLCSSQSFWKDCPIHLFKGNGLLLSGLKVQSQKPQVLLRLKIGMKKNYCCSGQLN